MNVARTSFWERTLLACGKFRSSEVIVGLGRLSDSTNICFTPLSTWTISYQKLRLGYQSDGKLTHVAPSSPSRPFMTPWVSNPSPVPSPVSPACNLSDLQSPSHPIDSPFSKPRDPIKTLSISPTSSPFRSSCLILSTLEAGLRSE